MTRVDEALDGTAAGSHGKSMISGDNVLPKKAWKEFEQCCRDLPSTDTAGKAATDHLSAQRLG